MEINLSLGITDKVSAVNRILEAMGSVGINSEEELDYNIDAADADKLLDAVSQSVQINMGKGWWFNREEFHKLSPDPVNGTVSVPNNTLVCLVKRAAGKVLPVTIRGTKLFDTKEVGYDMRGLVNSDGVLECILVVNLPFDYLPASAKHAVTDAARFWTVNDKDGDTVKMQELKEAANTSFISLQAEDVGQKRRNMFNNPYIQNAVMRSGGGFNNA